MKFDARDTIRPGQKFAQHEIQGVPIRIAIGPKDLQNKTVEIARRDNLTKDYVKLDIATDHVIHLLDDIQSNLHQRALKFRDENITRVDTFDEFKAVLENKGGFISAHWDGSSETENKIKELTKATIRCIPESTNNETGNCVLSGNPSSQRVLFAKAY